MEGYSKKQLGILTLQTIFTVGAIWYYLKLETV